MRWFMPLVVIIGVAALGDFAVRGYCPQMRMASAPVYYYYYYPVQPIYRGYGGGVTPLPRARAQGRAAPVASGPREESRPLAAATRAQVTRPDPAEEAHRATQAYNKGQRYLDLAEEYQHPRMAHLQVERYQQARGYYEWVATRFADQREVVQLAQQKITEIDRILHSKRSGLARR